MSMIGLIRRSLRLYAILLGLCGVAAGCDLLPNDGPNANAVLANTAENLRAKPIMRIAMVGMDERIARDADQFYQPVRAFVPAAFHRPSTFGIVGIGDALRVTIWEPTENGVFAGRDKKGSDIEVRVDPDGQISLPYAGRIKVAGLPPAAVEERIVGAFTGKATSPQASVMITENVSSTVSVQGDVAKPGPYPVVKDQRLLDMVALAGGAKYPPYETGVRLTRKRSSLTTSLQEVMDQPEMFDVPVDGGDSLLLFRKTQKFLAFGAVLQPGEQIFRKNVLNLSDGLGQTLGLDAQRADAKAVFLFRREPLELAQRYGVQLVPEDRDTVPIVYQVNLRDPRSYFMMNTFPMRPNDILYVSQAPLQDAAKFFQILSGASATVAIPRTLGGNFPAGP
jgi:polysaccharide export outer membrane protein